MSLAVDVVKRGGARASEPFSRDKLHDSIVAACLSVRSPEGEAETTANNVCSSVVVWCKDKSEITSTDLRRITAEHLHHLHPEAAYIYKHHRLVL